jgi:hypothetical protein
MSRIRLRKDWPVAHAAAGSFPAARRSVTCCSAAWTASSSRSGVSGDATMPVDRWR